jgi:hypothetical protein
MTSGFLRVHVLAYVALMEDTRGRQVVVDLNSGGLFGFLIKNT